MIPQISNHPIQWIDNWQKSCDLKISLSRTILLERPYRTGCHHYTEFLSQEDCYSTCAVKLHRELCKCLPTRGLVYRKSLLQPDDRFCGSGQFPSGCNGHAIRRNCKKTCLPDCNQEHYSSDSIVIGDSIYGDNLTYLTILRKQIPVVIYAHTPALTWIQWASFKYF